MKADATGAQVARPHSLPRLALGLMLVLGAVAQAVVAAPPARAAKAATRYTIEELMASDVFAGLSFSPDNRKLLLTSTRSGAANLYEIPVKGGAPSALTSSQEPLSAIGYFPRDERILYTGDAGGNELTHLFVRERDGAVRDLTPGERVKAQFAEWAADGRSFFAATNERDARFFDLYEYSTSDYRRRLLFRNDDSYRINAISPDRRYVALRRIFDNANTYAYLYDANADSVTQLTVARKGGISSAPQFFSRDGASLFLTTDAGHEFQYLIRRDLATGSEQIVFKTDWDVAGASLSRDGRYIVVVVNEDARSTLRLFDAATLAPAAFENAKTGTVDDFAIAHGAPLMAIVRSNGDLPGDVRLLDLGKGSDRVVLHSLAPAVAQADLVPGEVVRFRSYDGLAIPGVLYVPKAAAKSGNLPAVVFVHGGPGDQSRIGYKPLTQYLVNHGYVVYDINNRGSRGSGRTFFHLDDRRHGSADLDDVVAARTMLVDTGYVDARRIAIMGGSYGGFMTLAALTFRPKAFAAGVDMYGVANWPRLLQNTPAWWEDLRRLLFTEMGDPTGDAEYLRSISPVLHAQNIVRPLMVLQGANDPRVLQQESDDIVASARANGTPVEYVVFPDEGHGFAKKANQITAWRAIKSFLDQHLGEQPAPSAAAIPPERQRLEAFFESVFERNLSRSPIRQSRLGIKTAQDRWDDISDERQAEDAELMRGDLQRLRNFDYDRLDPASQLSYRLFERDVNERLEGFLWRRNDYLVTQMGGMHRRVATTLLNSHPIAGRADADAYVARLVGVKPLMQQLVVELQRQEAAGVQPPRFVYTLTIGEAGNLLKGRPFEEVATDSPVLADFRDKIAKANLPAAEQQELLARAQTALRENFGPGYRRLIEHLQAAQQTATDDAGVWKLPNGAAHYRYALESYTTLPIAPEELHALGLREVARIHVEMQGIMRRVGFKGELQEFFTHLREDPRFYYPDTAKGRSQYIADSQALLDEVRGRQKEVLGLIPKVDVVVRPVEAWREQSSAKAFYQNPPQDGSRPGVFYINLFDMRAAPRYQLSAILYHEAIPGHHVETAVAYELPALPRFRKFGSVAAFSEGWGLYSERLAYEMGLYRDPYQDFGRLALELMRAVRLVVDTGLHEKRWTREQAIDYMDRNTPGSHYDNQREIERYIVLPGQATSYAVGMLKILELRERARSELGSRFDLKKFHDVVLGSGPLPLPLLQQNVEAWIRSQRVSG